MRLQLNPEQIQKYVDGICHLHDLTLQQAIAVVLGAFKDTLDPFTRHDLTAVLKGGGFPGDLQKDPDAWATIGAEINQKATSVRKGFYTQKRDGDQTHVPVADPLKLRPVPILELPATTVEAEPGVFWSPLLVEKVESLYSNDVGLRRIAVSQSSCFGNFSIKSNQCKSCPLASYCAQASNAHIATIAAALDAQTVLDIKNAKQGMKIIDPAPSAPKVVEQKKLPDGAFVFQSAFETVCSLCSKEVPEKSEAVHIPKRGVYHTSCAQELK